VLIDAYVETIPQVIRRPTVNILADNHVKLQKLTDFLAYQLHRRMATDPKNSERYQGMFIQIKLFHSLIERDMEATRLPQEDTGQAKDNNWYDEAVEGVKAFLKKD
jgi:hypothetical protein